jgi:glyoxylate reductase
MKQRVVITSEIPEIATEILSREFEVVVHAEEGVRSEDDLVTMLSEADAAITLVSDPVTRRVLESNPNLRAIGNYAVGVNNIDLDAAKECGVAVTNTPGVLTDATADLTIALMLAVTRRVVEGDRFLREGRFDGWHPLLLLGTSLQGKRLGIVGMGRIGTAVAMRALAFGMEIAYSAPSPQLEPERELGAVWLPLDELLRTSDVVSIHVPLNDATHHLIDARALELMKRDGYLVNTARGPIVDEEALADALAAGAIRGAALDVYENEPAVEPRLLGMENVVLLPHLGSATEETRHEMARTVAIDVARVLSGGRPRHRVV